MEFSSELSATSTAPRHSGQASRSTKHRLMAGPLLGNVDDNSSQNTQISRIHNSDASNLPVFSPLECIEDAENNERNIFEGSVGMNRSNQQCPASRHHAC